MSIWKYFLKQCIVGTSRSSFTPPQTEGKLAQWLKQSEDLSPEEQVLNGIAGIVPYWQAGQLLPTLGKDAKLLLDTTLPQESTTPCFPPLSVVEHLKQALHAEDRGLFKEFLATLAKHHYQLPYVLLPDSIELALNDPELSMLLLPCLGERGRWLVTLNPQWKSLISGNTSEETWNHGSRSVRMNLFAQLRQSDVEQAQTLLKSTWSGEAAQDRTQLVARLQINLSQDDQEFLKTCLSDRSINVRHEATRLLAKFPDSEVSTICKAMTEQMFALKRVLLKKKLHLALPEKFEKSWESYGVKKKPEAGEKLAPKAWWMIQWLSYCQPSAIAQSLSLSIEQFLSSVRQHDFRNELFYGLRRGAALHQDEDFFTLDLKQEVDEFAHLFRFYVPHLSHQQINQLLFHQLNAHSIHLFQNWYDFSEIMRLALPFDPDLSRKLALEVLPKLITKWKKKPFHGVNLRDLGLGLDLSIYSTIAPALEPLLTSTEQQTFHDLWHCYHARYLFHQEFKND